MSWGDPISKSCPDACIFTIGPLCTRLPSGIQGLDFVRVISRLSVVYESMPTRLFLYDRHTTITLSTVSDFRFAIDPVELLFPATTEEALETARPGIILNVPASLPAVTLASINPRATFFKEIISFLTLSSL